MSSDLSIKVESTKYHVDFLNGYRGTLALWVFIQHCLDHADLGCDYIYFKNTGVLVGVVGFFLLSSYLLTYRLLEEINEKKGYKNTILIFTKYLIRRFFRIYIPFVITCSFITHKSVV